MHICVQLAGGPLGTHSLRKTFALAVHEQLGRDLYRTQQALGHANIGSTIHYLPVVDAEIQQAIVAVSYGLEVTR